MSLRRRSLRLLALAMVTTLPLLATSGVASAKGKTGCHKTHTCRSGGGTKSGGGGSGAAPPTIAIKVSPNPLVETAASLVVGVVEVETSPSFAGDKVFISSSQLEASCSEMVFVSIQGNATNSISLVLDNEGNATAFVEALDCAPGTSLFEADLTVAPFYTATTILDALPPQVTAPGVLGFPANEVETGDTLTSGESQIYAVFYIETDPVYAEQTVEVSSPQLADRCLLLSQWSSFQGNLFTDTAMATATLDDDGNAIITFFGLACAPGDSQVIADVLAGAHPTYTTTYTMLPPAPTI